MEQFIALIQAYTALGLGIIILAFWVPASRG